MKTHTWILASAVVLLAIVLWSPQSAQAQVSFGYTGPYTSFYVGPTPYYSYYAPGTYNYVAPGTTYYRAPAVVVPGPYYYRPYVYRRPYRWYW
jgi:hypothetical protein